MKSDIIFGLIESGTSKPERPRILALFGSAMLLGAERANIEVLAALQNEGFDVLCLIRDEKWNTIVPPALEARGLACKKVPYIEHRLPGRLLYILIRNPWAFLRANWKFLRIVREFRPTHIHAYGQLFVLNFLIGLMLVSTPMVFRAGDEPTVHNWFWRATWCFVVWRTSRFVANAEFVASSLRASGVRPELITVIYNLPPARSRLTSGHLTLELPKKSRTFVFIGQIAEHKGPHMLVAAFRALAKEFPDVYLVLAGRISEWIGDAWARALRDSTAQDPVIAQRVTFLGQIDDVPGLLARCEAVVVPSLFNDPSPNVVMEAKAAGRAAIVFPRGGLPELIANGVDGLICREPSTEALVDALRTYFANPALSAAHGAAALGTMRRFGNAQFGKRWAEIYCH